KRFNFYSYRSSSEEREGRRKSPPPSAADRPLSAGEVAEATEKSWPAPDLPSAMQTLPLPPAARGARVGAAHTPRGARTLPHGHRPRFDRRGRSVQAAHRGDRAAPDRVRLHDLAGRRDDEPCAV